MIIEPPRDEILSVVHLLRKQRRFVQIEELLGGIPRDQLLAEADLCLALAGALSYLRRHGEAKELLLDAGPSVLRSPNRGLLRRWQLLLAIQLLDEGDLPQAEELLGDALAMAERHSDHRLIADANNSLGVIQSFRGEIERAVGHFTRSLLAWQNLGEAQGVGIAHFNLGLVFREWDNAERAVPHFTHAEEYFGREGIEEERVHLRAERALLFGDLGDLPLAEQMARSAVADSRYFTAGPGVRAAALRALGSVLIQAGDLEEGELALLAALNALSTSSAGILKAEIFEELAILYIRQGNHPQATSRHRAATAEYLRLGSTNHHARLQRRYKSLGGA